MRKLLIAMLWPALLGTWHGANAQYCTAGPSSTFDTNIEGVWLTGETYSITDSSGCPGVTGVRDFTSTDSADVEQGFTYTLEVVMGTCGGNFSSAAEVWIDWDQDGTFSSNESIGTWSGTPRDTVSFTFTAPMTSALGKTRMRVMLHEGGSLPLNPCGTYDWGAVHDYTIEVTGVPPACPFPTQLAVSGVVSNEATISWTAGGGVSWKLEWGPTGFQPGTGDSINTTQNPYTISGLASNTTYDVYLRDTCADGSLSHRVGPITFTTKCQSQPMPFVETFDIWPLPACFDLSGGTREWNQYTDANNINYARAQFWNWASGNNAMLTTPPIDINANAQLKFLWSRNQGTTSYQDRIIIRARELGTASWDTLWDKTGADLSTGTGTSTEPGVQSQEIIYLPAGYVGQDMEFQYLAISAWGPNFHMEELVVEATPPCIDPSGVIFSNTDGFSTDVNWNITGSYEHFYIEWGPQGYVPATGGTTIGSDTTSNLTYFIDTLTPSTCYDVYIRTYCLGNDSSTLAGPFNFCTTVSCPAPTYVTLNSLGTTDAQLGWNSVGTDWNIIIGPLGTTPGTGTVIYNVTDTFYDATGLAPATAYSFWVRDSCGVGDVSTWEGPFDFVTNCVPFSMNYHEDFSTWTGTDLPCWDLSGGTFDWIRYQSTHSVVARFWSFNTPQFGVMTSPEVDISQPAIIRFDWSKQYNALYPNDTLIVEVRDVTSSNWVELLMLTDTAFDSNDGAGSTTPGSFVQDTLVLDSATWTGKIIQVRFRALSGWGPNLFINNVYIDADPAYLSCPTPINLVSSGITEDEATLTWQGTATGDYELEYGPTPTSPGQGTLVPVTGNTHTLTGLSAQTHYDVYVREICSPGDTSLWSGKHSFRTECSVFGTPFLEPFDTWNADGEVDCWDFTGGTLAWFESTSGPYAEANFWGWANGNDAVLTSPLIELNAASHLVFKWSHLYSATYPDDSLAVMVKAVNATNWDVVWARGGANLESNDGAGNTAPGSFVTDSVALDSSLIGETIQVRFHAVSGYGPNLYIDSVQILSDSICDLPEIGYAANLQQLSFTDAEWNFDASTSLNGNDFIWIIDNDTVMGQSVNHTFTSNGTQTITLVVVNDCGTADSTFTIEIQGIDVESYILEQSFSVYPNPAENRATVQFEVVAGRSAEIAVYNAIGQKVYSKDLGRVSGTVQHSMDVSNLAQGVYFVKLLTDIGTVETRLVIQR